jgi:hypothetical protein
VYTADRSGGLLSAKGDNGRNRTASLSTSETVRFEGRIQDVTRPDIIAYASGYSEAVMYASQGINEARRLIHLGQIDEAVRMLDRVTKFSGLDDATMATAYLTMADAYLAMPGNAPLKGAHYIEQGLRFLDEGSAQYEIRMSQAQDILNSFGMQNAAANLQARVAQGAASGSMSVDVWGMRGQQASVRTVGADDTCDGAPVINVEPVPTLYTEAGMFIDPGEADYRTFTLTDPTTMRFQTVNSPGGGDSTLTLYNFCSGGGTPSPAGALAFDDDGGDGFLSLLNLSCLDPGQYWLRVGGFADGGSGAAFDLEVETIETCFVVSADEFEPDDEISLATQIGCNPLACPTVDDGGDDEGDDDHGGWGWHWWWWGGNDDEDDENGGGEEPCAEPSTQTHTFTDVDFIDWVTFTVGTTGRVVIETAGTANTPNADTLIALSTHLGGLFGANDDKSFFDRGSKLDLCLPPGQYNVGVIPGLAATLLEFEYTITVQHTDCDCKFEAEPNAACGMATAIGYPDLISGVYEPGGFNLGDFDWYTFTLDATTDLEIETSGGGGEVFVGDTLMELYSGCPDELGNFVAGDDDGGPGFFSRLCLDDVPAGTYYLLVTGFGGGAYPYDLSLDECVPPTPEVEPNNTCGTSNPSAVPEVHSGAISPAGTDRDYYEVSLGSDQFVIFETLGNDDTVLRLYPSGSPNCGNDAGLLGCNDDKSASDFMSFLPCCLAAGNYDISVGDWQNLAVGSVYELTITSQGACVPTGTCPIELGGFSTCLVLP